MSGHHHGYRSRKLYYVVLKDDVNVKELTVAYMLHEGFECNALFTPTEHVLSN